MDIILLLASLIGTALGILLLIFVLVLIDETISYVKAKTSLTNLQLDNALREYRK